MAFGASPEEWAHFSAILGLTEDLLPVVSNPNAEISEKSKMKGLGKTPSMYNRSGKAVGFPSWTHHASSHADITRWRKERDYGICLQTRTVRAIDIDIPDPNLSGAFVKIVLSVLGRSVPARRRADSGKILLCFDLPGDFTKRKFTCEGGIVEFLATGQQFVAVGQHPDGARYEWEGGLPDEIPEITPEQFEELWQALVDEFAIDDPTTRTSSVKKEKLTEAHLSDPRAKHLLDNDWVLNTERDGRLHIRCPFEDEHTSESAESATTYWPAHTGGYVNGHYACLHAHCEHRTDAEFDEAVGYSDPHVLDDFSNLDENSPEEKPKEKQSKFTPIAASDYAVLQSTDWIIKGVLPNAEVGVIFGEPGSGKTFAALDMAMGVARGENWRNRHVHGGRVVYVAAEGAAGLRKRLLAYSEFHDAKLKDIPLDIIAAAPNLLQRAEVLELAKIIKATGGAQLIVVDTFAQATAGGNENSGEDVGKALAHCRGLHVATGALVLLVHHSGKDTSKGARGWSGLRAAVDVEMEVNRYGHDRALTVSKQKDGEDGGEFAFKLAIVELGQDADGDPTTSCVVSPLEGSVKGPDSRKALRGTVEKTVMRVVDQMTSIDGSGLTEGEVRQAVVDQLIEPPEGTRDRRAYKVDRALETLLASGWLEKKDGRIIMPEGQPPA